jgi:phage shock protein E
MSKRIVILTSIGVAVGALVGYIYYATVGCSSGGCAITSSPVNSTLYGSVMGGLLFSTFDKKKSDKNKLK